MNRLTSISDVCGGAIVSTNGSVLSWRTKDGNKPTLYVEFALDYLSKSYHKKAYDENNGLFRQWIIDHNGYKLLIGNINSEMIFLLLLDRKAYLGLTMLDMESFLREMSSTTDNQSPNGHEVFD